MNDFRERNRSNRVIEVTDAKGSAQGAEGGGPISVEWAGAGYRGVTTELMRIGPKIMRQWAFR